jgi:glycosyltransferase involved in cell wall biosynthesis/SAM-dependent methyltransferase
MPPPEALLVHDDETDFYGEHYFDRIAALHNLPALGTRARADLPERCVHWLRGLLRYRQPPARILELGSSHGGFVAMMRWAGFDAIGLDLSPKIVAGARRRFGVPMLEGPVESQDLAPGSLDTVVLMDVLEHLGDPESTLRHCLRLLKPDGQFFLQTPQYREGKSLAEMEKEGDPFLRMLKPDQHLYLFSKSSVRLLFGVLGVEYVTFEPAIFSFYDMALVAGRTSPTPLPESEAIACLEASPSGRLVLALYDLNRQFEDLTSRYSESEADRATRLENIFKMEKLLAEQAAGYSAQVAAGAVEAGNVAARCEDLCGQIRTRDERINELADQVAERDGRINELAGQVGGRDGRIEAQAAEIRDLTLRCQRDSKAEHLLERLQQSHVFRLMRRLHLWGWLDVRAPELSAAPPSFPGKTHGELRTVAVDLTPVLPGGGNGGAKVMTLELIRHLARIAKDTEFILLTAEQSHDELGTLDAPNVHRLCVNRPGAALAAFDNLALRARSVLARILPPGLLAKVAGVYRQASESLPGGNSLVRRLGADLLFCPFTAPFFFDPAVPTVCVVYDLQHAYYPQFFAGGEIQERDRNLARAVRVASLLVCISGYVRNTLLEKTEVVPDRAEVIHIQLPHRLARPSVSECEQVLKSLDLASEGFLLYPANFWPHKNHEMLLTAFGIYLAGHPGSNLKLVLTGSAGARQDFLKDAVHRMGLSHAVLFLGYLPDTEFSSLFHSCMAVIFPSLFEGFGMPLLEGMAAGRPLLCSNNTSLPEVAGDAALFFDPRIPAEIARAITRIASDPGLRRDLAEKGAQRLAAFGGAEEMAASYLKLFRKVVQWPAVLPPGIYGVFDDGWVGDRFTIAWGSGKGSRTLRISLTLPAWVSAPALSVRVEALGAAPRICSLVRGEVAVIESPAGSESGSIRVSCWPSFQPSLCGFGEDTRSLTCQLQLAEIVGDGVPEVLRSMGYGS